MAPSPPRPVSRPRPAARRPPAPAAPRRLRLPPFERHRLAGGLTVLAARQPRLPLVRLDLLAPAGAVHDPPGKAGLATLTATLLDEGARGGTATDLAEQLGGTLHCGATWNTADVNVMLHSAHRETAVALLAQTFLDSTFQLHQIERLKRQRLANLIQQQAEPRFAAELCLARALFGPGAYGGSMYGDHESVSGLEREDFLAFYGRHYSPATATLVAVGDLEVQPILRLAEELLDAGADAPAPPPRTLPPRLGGLEVHVLDLPHRPQVEIRVACPTVGFGHPDATLVELASSVLSGTVISRINRALRERLGITYGVVAQLEPRLGFCLFTISAAVAVDGAGAAVNEILSEIRRLGEEPVPPVELDDARNHLRGKVARRLQSIEGLVNQLSVLAVHDLPMDHFDRYLADIESADAAELLRAARRHVDPHRLAVVAAGPSSLLVPQLAHHGPVRVWPAAAGTTSSHTGRQPWMPS